MKSSSLPLLILLLLGSIFTAIGITVGLVFGKPILDNARASEQWPQTQGRILESELAESIGDDGDLYSVHIVYRYALDGGEFESERIWFGGDYSTSNRAEMFEVVTQYPVGQPVTVYYSPENPAESVLLPGAYASSYVLFAIGMTFLTIGSGLLLGFTLQAVRSIAGLKTAESQFRDAAFDDLNYRDGR